jgi:hypothetical protein
MKIIISISFVLISLLGIAQQSTINKITIIGVKHNGNKHMNGDSLLNILNQINPGIIFNESIFKQNASLFSDLVGLNRSIEIIAPHKYLLKYLETEQIQIDIKFKSLYHRWRYVRSIIKLDKGLNKIINRIYILKETPDSVKYSIMKYVSPYNYFYNLTDTNNLHTINQSFVIDSCRLMYTAYENNLLPIINSYPSFSNITKRANKEFSIWKKRNETMTSNILNRIKNDTINKPIVILCGLAHKYALEDLLKPEQEKYNFKLYDYWELYK